MRILPATHCATVAPLRRTAAVLSRSACPRPGTSEFSAAQPPSTLLRTGAFSLLEMMVAVTLLLLIIVALSTVFYQTQRAFRLSATQEDILEAGRATMQLLTGELAETTPSYQNGQINLFAQTEFPFLVQPRPASEAPRVNVLQDIFFLRQHGDEWIATGYFVVPPYSDPVGTLYRFQASVYPTNLSSMPLLFGAFQDAITNYSTKAHRVIDRVVSLKLSPYDAQGQFLTNLVDANYSILPNSFTNNLLPYYLDLELGILEPRAFEKYKALAGISSPADPRGATYLTNHVEKVHLFRQRIPIRAAP